MGTPNETLTALFAGLATALPGRKVTRDFKTLAQRGAAELLQGVVTLVCRGEDDYANYLGREAQLGTINAVLVGQLKVADNAGGLAVEQAEFVLAEEIKAFLRGPMPAGVTQCLANGFAQSGQLEAPYGWVAFELEVKGG